MNTLVCVKRAPDPTGEVVLTPDGRGVDGRYAGYSTSPHEEAAVEIASQLADGDVAVLTLGDADAVEQLRAALAVGATRGIHIEADADAFGPSDVAAAIAEVVTEAAEQAAPYDLVLLGNDAADTGDHQVGIRLAHALGWPVVVGIQTVEVADGVATCVGQGPAATEVFEVALPAVVTVLEGGVEPRYPSVMGRMKAKKAPVEVRHPSATPAGSGRTGLRVPPPPDSRTTVIGEGPSAAGPVVELLHELGVVPR